MQMRFTPEMMMIAEEMGISHVRLAGSQLLSHFDQVDRFASKMNVGLHAEFARERLAAYAKAKDAIEAAFVAMDEALGDARAAEDARDRQRAHAAREAELDAQEDAEKITRADRLMVRAARRIAEGGQAVCLSCPVCENGDSLDETGVCTKDGAYAIDIGDPKPETTVRYKPKPKPDAADALGEAPPGMVRIAKGEGGS